MRSTASVGERKLTLGWVPSGAVASTMAGRPRATRAMAIKVKLTCARDWLKRSVLCLRPARRRLVPSTSSSWPRTEPMSDVRTKTKRPWLSAAVEMISSAALPNVALRRPPETGPSRSPRASVAWPSQ